jgi:bifunctional DNA-binding transcriptional regulator/antitoxin component of YhaV-PrlF toxin-antitoxin module
MKENTEISKVWVTGKSSYTIVIPKRFATDLKLDSNSHLLIEKTLGGLLIRKLEVET